MKQLSQRSLSSIAMLLFLLSVLQPVGVQAQSTPTIFWTGAGNALWNNPANWDLLRVPNSSDHVAITSGSNVTLNVSASVASLVVGADSGTATQRLSWANNSTLTLATNSAVGSRGELYLQGQINGAGLLEVRGYLQWANGQIFGKITVAEGGRLQLTGGYYALLNSGVTDVPALLTNRGTVIWSGGYSLYSGNAAQIYNYGEWRCEGDGNMLDISGGSPGTFHNFGTLTKTGGAGTTSFLNIHSILNGGGTVNASVGTLQFNVSSEWLHGNQVTGAGKVVLQNGSATLSGTTTVQGSWEWRGVNVYGNGTIGGSNPLVWRTGRVFGALTIAPGARMNFSGEYYPILNSGNTNSPAVITNYGTVAYVGGYSLYAGFAAQIYNFGQWRMEADGDVLEYSSGGDWPTFHNLGTLTKTAGTGNSSFQSSLTRLYGGGTVNVSSGTLQFNQSTIWEAGNQITGAGRVLMNGGNTLLSGTTVIQGRWEWQNVSVTGNGTIAGPNPLLWRTGRVYGALTVAPGAELKFSGQYYPLLNSGTTNSPAVLTNLGTVTYVGGYPLYAGYAAQIYNHGQWRLENDGDTLDYSGGGDWPTFHNFNLLTKSGGGGTTTFADSTTILHGGGTVNAAVGTLQFIRSTIWNDGNIISGAGTVLMNGGNTALAGTSTVQGSWVWVTVSVTGSGTIAGPGPLTWRTGRVAGALTIAEGSQLNFSGEFYPLLSSGGATSAVLTNRGVVNYVGGYQLYAGRGAQIFNYGEWRLNADGNALDYTDGGAASTFNNLGTIVKTGGIGTTTFASSTVNNPGRIWSRSGTFALPNSFNNSGEIYYLLGATNGVVSVAGTWVMQGALRVEMTNSFVPASGFALNVLQGNNLVGNFGNLLLPELTPDLGWTVDYSPTVAQLRITDACFAGGLVGWWSADNGAADMTGTHDGSLLNGATTTNGFSGQAFLLNGVNQSVALGSWTPGNRWTLQAWVNLSTNQPGRHAILGGLNNCQDWALTATDGYLGVSFRAPGICTVTLTNASPAQTNTWYHLAATCDGAAVNLYLNGTLVGTAACDPNYQAALGSVMIGRASYGNAEFFAGKVDEATIHNRALAPSEISTTYANGANGRCAQLGLGVLSLTPLGLVNSNLTQFTIRFNQPFQTNTFTGSDITVTTPTGSLTGTNFTIAAAVPFDGRTFRINSTPLTNEGAYTISVGPNIQTLSGAIMTNGAFIAAFKLDKTGPRIIASSPASPASNQVSIVEVTFSEAISTASATGADVNITGPGNPVVSSVTQLATNQIRFTLNQVLGNGSYTITIGPNITDLAGNTMDQDQNGVNGEAINDQFTLLLQTYRPDLAPGVLQTPALATAGQGVNFVYAVTNLGGAPVSGNWSAYFWLATNATGLGSGFLGSSVVTNLIQPGATLVLTQSLVLPSGIVGNRFLGVTVDAQNQIVEVVETNNVAWDAIGTAVSAPDLVITNFSAPASAQLGSTFPVTWTRRNIGSAATFTAGQDQIFLSASPTSASGARLLGTVAGLVQAAGNDLQRTQSVSIPLITSLPAGNYWLLVVADSPNSQAESDESNNIASRSITLTQPPTPDLAIADFTTPTKLFPGADMQIRWTTTNSGTLGLTNGIWVERLSFTNSTVGRITLGEWEFTNSFAIGGALSRTQFVSIPLNLAATPGWLALTVDEFDDVVELTETNNSVRTDTQIPVSPRLFLQFSAANLVEGGSNVIATVSRNGSTTAAVSVTLSNDFPARLVMTNQITIPSGAASANFPITLPVNGIVDGTVIAHLTATATNFLEASELLTLNDESSPFLTVTISTNQLREGLTLAATVTRSLVSTQALMVFVGTGEPLSLSVPPVVDIPAGQPSYTFAVLAPDNNYFDGTRTNSIRVGALNFDSATNTVRILDDDLPNVWLELSSPSISESGGPQAGNINVRLSTPSVRNVVVDL
ncbi:MAG: Ig-like domain-containing protein, partial [Akkermansiaceae bacterium]|nr:Ig-like domain-containing protein [Verrucomicrobiales bacterium]